AIVQSLEESLNRLQTDHIDLYWLHMWEYRTPVDEVMRALDDLVRAGKILYIACSDTPAWIVSQAQIMAELRGWTRFIALQAEYSLVERTSERDLIPMADACGLGVMAWSPLGGGILTGKYSRADLETADESPAGRLAWLRRDGRLTKRHIEIAQCVQQIADERGETAAEIALAWVRQQPGVASTIIGARTKEQLSSNIASLSVQLEHSELDRLDSISAIDLGFPRSFIDGPSVKAMISGGAAIA
ncbi:MAG: aldo/keto reductase, partial [Pseudomonadota bacterium]